jgi:hypothetical protein
VYDDANGARGRVVNANNNLEAGDHAEAVVAALATVAIG